MPMYRPSTYFDHNSSLKKFMAIFNPCAREYKIRMFSSDVENFSDDGVIIFDKGHKLIIFDWEKRQNDYITADGKLKFPTLGQFERKFHKDPKIGLTIQCNKDETYFIAALHSSFGNDSERVSRTTDSANFREYGKMRTTAKFKIYGFNVEGVQQFINDITTRIDSTDFFSLKEQQNHSV